jgi:hypothetical protein
MKRSTLRSRSVIPLLIPVLLLLVAFQPASAQGYLHASGLYIVDGSNNQIILRGMGLGGWLVPEGYMLGTSSFADSPTAFKNVVTQLVGAQNAETFFQAYRAGFVRKKDIDSLAKWGFNSVRLPMHYNLLTSAPGVYLESGFAIIDSLLDWCEANQIYLILDLHAAPGGQNTGNISDYQGPPSLWESTIYQDWTASLWKTIAARYKNEPWIGGYDILNETAWTFPSGNGTLRAFLVRLTDSVRSVDQNHLIFAEGNWYATDFSGLTPAWDANMAWSFHKYWNVNDYNAISYLLSLRSNTQRPLWLGESGENSNHWFSECLMWMELNKIGWSWWTLKKIESISAPLSVTKTAGFDALINYWSGQAAAPSVTTAMNYLLEQASKFESENCTLRPDYLNALFGSPTPGQRRPYRSLTIPGTIHAVHYDMGKNQEAYVDVDHQNLNGNGGSTYNSGWTYRNDGVDIERSSDPLGNGYNVGWTSAGEWLGYTVNVPTGGTYAISARVASASGGGSMSLVLDGGESMPFNVPSTGGWQSWSSLSLGQVNITSGVKDLRVKILTAGFNFSSLTFTLVTAAEDDTAPRTVEVSAAYPNPFNPETRINVTLPSERRVVMAVTDMLGRVVHRADEGLRSAGTHAITWNAAGMPSGVYFYTCEVRPASGLEAPTVRSGRIVLTK